MITKLTMLQKQLMEIEDEALLLRLETELLELAWQVAGRLDGVEIGVDIFGREAQEIKS